MFCVLMFLFGFVFVCIMKQKIYGLVMVSEALLAGDDSDVLDWVTGSEQVSGFI